MIPKTCLVVLLVIEFAFASNHLLEKRETSDGLKNQGEPCSLIPPDSGRPTMVAIIGVDTNQLSQFLSNTWETLRDRLNASRSQSSIRQLHSNLTDWRHNLFNMSGEAAREGMARLQNLTQGLNNLLRERTTNDRTTVNRLIGMLSNGTARATQSPDSLRQALTSATQIMAENYSGLANSSIQLATDLMNRGRELFNEARIRASNDTNRAVKAVNTAIDAIRNSSQPVNQTLQGIAADLAHSAQRLSAGLRTLMNQTSTAADTTYQAVTSDQFRERAEESLQKLSSNLNRLRTSISQMANNTATNIQSNLENNEINVIDNVSTALTREYEELQNHITALRRQANSS